MKGVDTIQGLTGTPPMEISIPKTMVVDGTSLMREWNRHYLAFIPYCFYCKEPLDWYIPPEGNHVFSCPKCGRKWKVEG